MDTYKITKLKQGVKNPERINVFINNEFSFSLDEVQIVDLGIKVGRIISSKELSELKKEGEFSKLYQRTLEWVLMRPRSVRETKDYLYRKLGKNNETNAKRIIERLSSRGYLDDEKFARWYVENRFLKKGISQKRLTVELVKKGVEKTVIDEVLDTRNDEEEVLKIIEKKRKKYDKEKMMAYLCRQGFSYDLVKEMMERVYS